MDIRVRPAVESDLSSIMPSFGPRGDPPWDPFDSLERLRTIPRDGLLVAEVDGEFAGFVHWFPVTETDADGTTHRWARIYNLFVAEPQRRKGVGRSLMTAALRQIVDGAFEYVRIDTSVGNLAARRLYEQLGFDVTDRGVQYRIRLEAPVQR